MTWRSVIGIKGRIMNIKDLASWPVATRRITRMPGRGLSMKNAELNTLSEFLESQLNVPVANETGLTGLYNVELNWYNENPDHIDTELKQIYDK